MAERVTCRLRGVGPIGFVKIVVPVRSRVAIAMAEQLESLPADGFRFLAGGVPVSLAQEHGEDYQEGDVFIAPLPSGSAEAANATAETQGGSEQLTARAPAQTLVAQWIDAFGFMYAYASFKRTRASHGHGHKMLRMIDLYLRPHSHRVLSLFLSFSLSLSLSLSLARSLALLHFLRDPTSSSKLLASQTATILRRLRGASLVVPSTSATAEPTAAAANRRHRGGRPAGAAALSHAPRSGPAAGPHPERSSSSSSSSRAAAEVGCAESHTTSSSIN